jgi:hypothetical protein
MKGILKKNYGETRQHSHTKHKMFKSQKQKSSGPLAWGLHFGLETHLHKIISSEIRESNKDGSEDQGKD